MREQNRNGEYQPKESEAVVTIVDWHGHLAHRMRTRADPAEAGDAEFEWVTKVPRRLVRVGPPAGCAMTRVDSSGRDE